MRKTIVLTLAILLTFSLSCAASDVKPDNELREAVAKYFEYVFEGNAKGAYEMERMALREKATLQEYAKMFNNYMLMKKYDIVDMGGEGAVTAEDGAGGEGTTKITLKITSDWPDVGFQTPKGEYDWEYTKPDYWEKIDGKWYHVRKGLRQCY